MCQKYWILVIGLWLYSMVEAKELTYEFVPLRPLHLCPVLMTATEEVFVSMARVFACHSGKAETVVKVSCQLSIVATVSQLQEA